MSEHTPGPWVQDGRTIRCNQRATQWTKPISIAFVAAGSQRTTGEDEANARLIAAAPEMLESLRALAELPCESQIDDSLDCDDDNLCGICNRTSVVRALLARIDGGNHA